MADNGFRVKDVEIICKDEPNCNNNSSAQMIQSEHQTVYFNFTFEIVFHLAQYWGQVTVIHFGKNLKYSKYQI